MNIKKMLGELDFLPSENELTTLKNKTRDLVLLIQKKIKEEKIGAEIFVGGSLAKGTLVRKKINDVDLFVRFELKHEGISELLENVLLEVSKEAGYEMKRLHGSRDYFTLKKGSDLIFEIIPVRKISSPKKADNITDLSYFHVNYVKKHIKNRKKANETVLAKAFANGCGVYGAESYINGFSGYGLECLIIYYGSFEKMARSLVKVSEKIIIDPEKRYKQKKDIFLNVNESRLQSPIILIDPTWSERNVLAALSCESFWKFQKALREFLKKPSPKFFEKKDKVDEKKLGEFAKNQGAEILKLNIETDRPEGDIAGTKLKKFYNLLINELNEDFLIEKEEFYYLGGKTAEAFFVLSPKKEKIAVGPFLTMKEHVAAFRKRHRGVFEKDGRLYAKEKLNVSVGKFIKKYKRKNENKIKEMGITGIVAR
jgi:tRNA nucleotidyltransferase (CCA-adding enzyme)